MQFFNEIKNIFYPNICLSCEGVLTANEHILCTECLYDLPLINSFDINKMIVDEVFYGRVKIENAFALLSYHKKGITQHLIHQLKYKGHEEIGVFLGNWISKELINTHNFNTIDAIVPVPLHKNKLKKRGYNQVTKFGEQLSFHLKTPFVEDILIRKSINSSQTKKNRLERWKNVDEIFYLSDKAIFENKHLLLIDDILTTGATLEACANELLKASNVKISIVVMAITE